MSSILDSNDFGLKLYNRFPPKYREDDIDTKFALRRYFEALGDGGYKYSIEELNGILALIDPDKTPTEVLPILFRQYGLEVFNGIPERYLRYLLPRLGGAWSKKGSLSAIEFITSSLSGIKTSTNMVYGKDGNPIIDVRLEMDYNIGDYFPDVEQFNRLLVNFTPFYCDTNLIYTYMFFENIDLKARDVDDLMFLHVKPIEEIGSINLRLDDNEVDTYEDVVKEKAILESVGIKSSDVNSVTNNQYSLLNSSLITNGYSSVDIIRTKDGKVQTIY